jgi:hypothetical protein
MARGYYPTSTGVTAAFPSSVFTPWGARDAKHGGYSPDVSETGTIPGVGNNYTLLLNERILRNGTLAVTANGTPLTIVPYGYAVAANEVGISYDLPLAQFHSTRAGQTYVVTHTAVGFALSAQWVNTIEKELVAVQQALLNALVRTVPISGQPSASTSALVGRLYVPANGQTSRIVKRLTLFAGGIDALGPSGVTNLHVTTASTATDGTDISLPVVTTDLQKRWTTTSGTLLTIDTSGGDTVLNVFCTDAAGGHSNLSLEVFLQ